MNFAFPVLILTLATMPGFLLCFGVLRGTFARSTLGLAQFPTWIIPSIVASIPAHTLTTVVLHALGASLPNFGVLLTLTAGNYGVSGSWLEFAIQDLTTRPGAYTGYFLASVVLSYAAGLLLHLLLRQVDTRFQTRFLSTSDEWHYLIKPHLNRIQVPFGPAGAQRMVSLTPKDIYFTTLVDLKHASGLVLFRGLVIDYRYAPNGDIETLALTQAERRPLTRPEGPVPDLDGKLTPDGFYRIHGSRLVLRRSEMTTLNFAPSIVLDLDALPEDLQALLEAEEAQRDAEMDDVDDTD